MEEDRKQEGEEGRSLRFDDLARSWSSAAVVPRVNSSTAVAARVTRARIPHNYILHIYIYTYAYVYILYYAITLVITGSAQSVTHASTGRSVPSVARAACLLSRYNNHRHTAHATWTNTLPRVCNRVRSQLVPILSAA